jgi:hypothetical protein
MVDFVKQGFGTTNDDNTAQRFYEDPEMRGWTQDCFVDFLSFCRLLHRKEQVTIAKFREYPKETAELYCSKNLYSWYPMQPTVHELLIQGADIIENAVLPIGQL